MMCASVRVTEGQEGLSSREQLVRYLQRTPSRRGLLSGLGLIDCRLLFSVSQPTQLKLSASTDVSAVSTLTPVNDLPVTLCAVCTVQNVNGDDYENQRPLLFLPKILLSPGLMGRGVG